jgi:diadenosine tetraphosphate (Ap4A) HIT family hydrolase
MFKLHPQLEKDTIDIGRFELCRLLLMNDANYPWFILVPEREDITEIYQLSGTDQQQLIKESSILARALAESFNADKLNIAALGNVVPQLHIHHIVRYRTDPAWPAPVWGKIRAVPYGETAIDNILDTIKPSLDDYVRFVV